MTLYTGQIGVPSRIIATTHVESNLATDELAVSTMYNFIEDNGFCPDTYTRWLEKPNGYDVDFGSWSTFVSIEEEK